MEWVLCKIFHSSSYPIKAMTHDPSHESTNGFHDAKVSFHYFRTNLKMTFACRIVRIFVSFSLELKNTTCHPNHQHFQLNGQYCGSVWIGLKRSASAFQPFFLLFFFKSSFVDFQCMNSALLHCLRTYKFHFSTTFLLKMSSTTLFTHLKIIFYSVFSFSFQFQQK